MKQRIIIAALAVLTLGSTGIFSQENQKGPLGDYTFIRKPQDLATFGTVWASLQSYTSQQVYDFQYFPGRGDSMIVGPAFTRPESLWVSGHDIRDIITGNFTGDSRDEVASVWETPKRSVALAISSIDRLTNIWHDVAIHQSDTSMLINIPFPADSEFYYGTYLYRYLRLEKGNFDSDKDEELVLAYWAADSTLRIELYDGASGFDHPRAVISDQRIAAHLPKGPGDHMFPLQYFDIAVGDFDGDGISEVILFGKDLAIEPSAKMFAAVYDFNPLISTFTLKAKVNVPHGLTLNTDERVRYIYATAGRMNRKNMGDGFVAIAVADAYHHPYNYALLPFDVSNDLNSITFGTLLNFGNLYSLNSTDINNDGFDETFTVREDSLFILKLDTTCTTQRMFATRATPYKGSSPSNTFFSSDTKRSFAVADIDSDTSSTSWMPELIISETSWPPDANSEHRMCVYDFVMDSTGTVTGLHLRMWIDGYLPGMCAAGNFNGGDIHLGMPAHYSKTDILQPIVILNAPPVHFDVFDGIPYDISKSFGTNSCQHYSRYEKKSVGSVELQTKVSESWATSENFGGSLSYLGIGAKFSMEQRYGGNFSKVSNSSRTITISEEVYARTDDEILATIVNYDLWEYPVYSGEDLIGHIMVVDPLQVTNGRFPSRSWNAGSYVPNHEVGNILSYQRFPNLADNEDVGSLIKGTYENSYTLHESPLATWNVNYNDFISSNTETTKKIGLDVEVGSFLGISFEGKDSYDREEISTHQTSVTQDLSMSVHLDAIDLGLGEVRYTVTPYSYWAKNGALVIDYAVQPDLASPGYTPTWWQVHYDTLPDPAFILPWRLDPEKGYTIQDGAKRYETKEIMFSPSNAAAEDTVLIRARIHNFSLAPTLGPVKMRFYVGDPDSGGTPIVGIHGETDVTTASFIRSRENSYVEMQWKIPSSLPQYPRIYGVIDPDHQISEIHENNNKGFSVLGKQDNPTGNIQEAKNSLPERYSLAQNYPNPFNPNTTIEFALPVRSQVTLKIYDLLGREITTLMNNESLSAGSHLRQWNAANFPSGVYFYRLQTGNYIETKKLVLMK